MGIASNPDSLRLFSESMKRAGMQTIAFGSDVPVLSQRRSCLVSAKFPALTCRALRRIADCAVLMCAKSAADIACMSKPSEQEKSSASKPK
jgi:hypothetical protein